MRLLRDTSGEDLAKQLAQPGYRVTRQTGSQMRLTRGGDSEHHITIPRHRALRVGTLNNVLKDIAEHLKIDKEDIVRMLWRGDLP